MTKVSKKSQNKQSCKTGVMPRLYVCMTSGGRTSMIMAKHLKENPDKYPNVLYVFLNTGKEDEKTLQFVDRCDKEWNLGILYLEASVNCVKGKGTTYKIVDFETASRNGEPFEAMLKKYPLPNNKASNCTRELKQRPIDAYLKDLQELNSFKEFAFKINARIRNNYFENNLWKKGSLYKYFLRKKIKSSLEIIRVIGIRADEAHRKSIHAKEENIIYPLCDEIPFNEKMVRLFWEKQSFDLGLKDYEGNCDLCFKKSLKKRLTIIKENPEKAKWWLEMEQKYSSEEIPRFDLRTNKSIEELVEMAQRPFTKAEDLHELSKQQCDLFEIETDCFCKAS
jgi:3'-phosphoadenosine 5'-phosphosulfate sulfotransferase (PAPS reductase)/FAD synthetase